MRRTRVLSVQTPLLGHTSYARLLRGTLAESERIELTSRWADDERARSERSPLGRLVYRLCFTFSRDARVRERNLDLYSLRYELGSSFWARRVIDREFRRQRPDVLHLHTQALAYASIDVMRRIPTVISGDMTSVGNAEQFTRTGWRWTHGLQHLIEGATFRSAAALAPFSEYAARSMRSAYGVDASRIRVVSPGVDLGPFASIGRERGERTDRMRRILFVGGEFARKGGDTLIRAFLRGFAERGDVELHLVTGAEPTVRHPRIFWHAGVRAYDARWRELFDRATLFALPTRREAYGHVYLEAAASALPVVGSTVGAGPELVQEGRTGYLVDPDDPAALEARLGRLLDDADERARLGEAGRARVYDRFDAARTTRDLERLFLEVSRSGAGS